MSTGRDLETIGLTVSRETLDRLYIYVSLLEKWNPRINLVAARSLADVWDRHILDSAQLWLYRPTAARSWLDIGSGAGLPGLILAALAAEQAPQLHVSLVESDTRKSVFLMTAAREMGLAVNILSVRYESLPHQNADVVSARALAPLPILLEVVEKHRNPQGIGLFPKGETVHKELVEAERLWRFTYTLHPSKTDSRAAIVEIGATGRV